MRGRISRGARALALVVAAVGLIAPGRAAQAQMPVTPPAAAVAPPAPLAEPPPISVVGAPAGPGGPSLPGAVVVELPERAPPPRPRFSVAVGMGVSFEPIGYSDGAHAVPAFFATGGAGDGLVGVDFGAFVSSAAGRERQADPIDRLALDVFGVFRPGAALRRADAWGYGGRVLRGLGVELGLGVERAGRTTSAATRAAVHTGARVDFPLTPASSPSQLRARIAVRRAFGLHDPEIQGATDAVATVIGDSTLEASGALVVVF